MLECIRVRAAQISVVPCTLRNIGDDRIQKGDDHLRDIRLRDLVCLEINLLAAQFKGNAVDVVLALDEIAERAQPQPQFPCLRGVLRRRCAVIGELLYHSPRLFAQFPHGIEHLVPRAFLAPQHIAYRQFLLLLHGCPPLLFIYIP